MMKRGMILILAFLSLAACDAGSLKLDVEELDALIKKEVSHSPSLGFVEAHFAVVFLHQESNLIETDDVYFREDKARVTFGYDLKDTNMQVEEGALCVQLPSLIKRIATNREPASRYRPSESTHQDYILRDRLGNRIHVEKLLDEKVDQTVVKHRVAIESMAKENALNFFRVLAARHNLSLAIRDQCSPTVIR